MRIYRPPKLLQLIYPGSNFAMSGRGRTIYLTFDDGPTDGVTQPVIEILKKHGVPATFFVCGIQVETYPGLFDTIIKEGHSIGNHGYRHLNGFKTPTHDYLSNVELGAEISGSDFFRPPYGKIRPVQYRVVRRKYMIVFWSIMPYDFDSRMSAAGILNILKKGIRPGSIIALHDNNKSKAPEILDEFIKYSLDYGYSFESLERLNLVR
jgi:peptidoglycan/xylan/chitin deacetylase (PgdA/CDA1 family)